jgi:dihydrodipicolinate synthase/N-acetylneuraminate lyase
VKSMMDLIGLTEGRVRPPLPDLRPDEVDEVHRLVEKWKTVLWTAFRAKQISNPELCPPR